MEIENHKIINSQNDDMFWYNIGLRYFKQFVKKYPTQSNFRDKDIINEIILMDKYLCIYKEPFDYVIKGIDNIILDFTRYKNILEFNYTELDINEIINFAEELVRAM